MSQAKLTKLTKAVSAIATNSESELVKSKKGKNVKKNEKTEEKEIELEEKSEIVNLDESFKTSKKKDDIVYKKLQLHDQILMRPDTYIGSVKNAKTSEPVFLLRTTDSGLPSIVKDYATYPDGLIRIFMETLSNAIDNVWRSVTTEGCNPTLIKIWIDREKGCVKVWNDGRNIPVSLHETEKVYIPEMIFGHLLTSSNYNDGEERKTSGLNGLGCKLVSLFSTSMNIKVYNKGAGVLYEQEWKRNMYDKGEPVLTKITSKNNQYKTNEDGKNGFTQVEFFPDFSRFGLTKFTDDVIAIYEKLVYDCAMTVSMNKVRVQYNGKDIPIKSIKDYVKLYFANKIKDEIEEQKEEIDESDEELTIQDENEEKSKDKKKNKKSTPSEEGVPIEHLLLTSDDCRVMVCSTDCGEFTHVSFVNGIYTKYGGAHVDKWSEALFRPLVEKLNDNKKRQSIDIRDVKKHFFIFVYASVDKPSFDSQSKNKLSDVALQVNVKKTDIAKLSKWEFMEKIENSLKMKEMLTLKNTERKKRGVVRVEGLDDANFAGQKGKAQDCILTLSEGLSAKTYIVKGMKYGINGKAGHDYIGVLPIRGKFLNVRNSSIDTLVKNKEVKAIIQALGLQYDLDYTDEENFKKLRYGKLLLCTDADVDGLHISGLLLNFFHFLFPTLLNRKGFFTFMRVPILKIQKGKQQLSFFFQEEATRYIQEHNVKKDNIKYYKGLGTANDQDIKEDFGRRIVELERDQNADNLMNKVFGKENTDFRKDWITRYLEDDSECKYPVIEDYKVEQSTISNFLNEELINFSIDDCHRSIPHMLDGFKESHRKVVYSAFKKNLKYSGKTLKVAQFAGYVAENSNYHHGEQNLYDTITKLAQRFVGSNNIPILFNDGQVGERIKNGQDAANGRYIFTKLDMLTRFLFREEDDAFLKNREDDGDVVEKEYYLPIVPMVLVNGCSAGIGTGWSTNVPQYNLTQLIQWITNWMKEESNIEDKLVPWYRNFKGEIKVDGKKIITTGIVNTIKEGEYRITEIPLGRKNLSIARYKELLEELKEKGKIKLIKDYSTEANPDFIVVCEKDEILTVDDLQLVDTISMNNMVLFNSKGQIYRYESVEEIIHEFCQVRLALYQTRKDGIVNRMEKDLKYIRNKIRFIGEVVNNTISLKNRTDEDLHKELIQKKYDAIYDDENIDESEKKEDYSYLLNIQVRSMTGQRLKELQEKEKKMSTELEEYRKKTIKQIWTEELTELEEKYNVWVDTQIQEIKINTKTTTVKKNKK